MILFTCFDLKVQLDGLYNETTTYIPNMLILTWKSYRLHLIAHDVVTAFDNIKTLDEAGDQSTHINDIKGANNNKNTLNTSNHSTESINIHDNNCLHIEYDESRVAGE